MSFLGAVGLVLVDVKFARQMKLQRQNSWDSRKRKYSLLALARLDHNEPLLTLPSNEEHFLSAKGKPLFSHNIEEMEEPCKASAAHPLPLTEDPEMETLCLVSAQKPQEFSIQLNMDMGNSQENDEHDGPVEEIRPSIKQVGRDLLQLLKVRMEIYFKPQLPLTFYLASSTLPLGIALSD